RYLWLVWNHDEDQKVFIDELRMLVHRCIDGENPMQLEAVLLPARFVLWVLQGLFVGWTAHLWATTKHNDATVAAT
ncbi:hypothetical protein AAVH_39035, partial [Aphelenchoides avenae]